MAEVPKSGGGLALRIVIVNVWDSVAGGGGGAVGDAVGHRDGLGYSISHVCFNDTTSWDPLPKKGMGPKGLREQRSL